MEGRQMLPTRFSSCRGASFEMNQRRVVPSDLLGQLPPQGGGSGGSTGWQWPVSISAIQRATSRPSSHFCDLNANLELEEEEEEEEEEEKVMKRPVDLESAAEAPKEAAAAAVATKPPPKNPAGASSRLSIILLDQGLFTVYKRLFVVCFALNIIALVLAIVGKFPYARKNAAVFSMGNILALTVCRNEATLRLVFWLAVKILGRPWVPLPVKTATTSFLQSLGGIHSGCGVSSVAWLTYALVRTTTRQDTSAEIIGVAYAILFLLSLSCLAAFPLLRHLHHNVFERTHRFAGWTALALLWVFVILSIGYDPESKSYENLRGQTVVRNQGFWLTASITFLIILPWLTVWKVPVSVTAPSGHASIIKFAGGIKAGILGRISRSPLSEWHAFGIISDAKDSHMILAGAVGDFTKGLVTDPPTHLWVRGVHFAGLPYLVNMYNRAVLVATGSGICVFLSFLLQPCAADVCIVWVTKGVERNFGKEIMEMMSGFPKEKVIVHDTAVLGRPNVSEMAVEAARNWKAEVVVVTSNPQGSRDVVRACKTAGFAAFGPIWDS